MLIEQFLKACDKSMVLFLKEYDIKPFEQFIDLAEMYMEAPVTYEKKSSFEGHGRKVANLASGDCSG